MGLESLKLVWRKVKVSDAQYARKIEAKLDIQTGPGLSGTVTTKDAERGKRVARQIDTGMVFINQATWTAPNLPFGGVKNSGFGRELSELGMARA